MPPRYTWYDCSSFMQTEEDEDGTTIDLLDGIYEYTALHFTFEGTAKGGETVTLSHWSLTELPRCDTLQGKVDADGSVTIEGEFGHDRMLHVDHTGLSGVTIRNRLYPLGAFGIVIYAASTAALYLLLGLGSIRVSISKIISHIRQIAGNIPDNRRTGTYIAFFLISQAVILSFLILFGDIRYMTNDDTTMAAIAGGGYGGIPSQYIVNIHTLIGYLLKKLYTVCSGVNWLTILYLILYALSFVLLDILLVRLSVRKGVSLTVSFIVLDLSFFLFHVVFTFTGVAYALLIAGTVCAFGAQGSPKRKAVALIYILTAAMMRNNVIYTAVVMVGIYGVLTLILTGDKKRTAKLGIFIVVLVGIELISYGTNAFMLDRNLAEANFFEWGEERSSALDCKQVPYSEALKEKGMSEASYEACYNGFYYVSGAVSEEKMQLLEEANTHKYNPDIAGYFIHHFRAYSDGTYAAAIWQFIFGVLAFTGIVYGKGEYRWRMLSLYIAVICTDLIYYIIGRQLPHVMIPTYIMGMIAAVMIHTAGIRREHMRKTAVWVLVAFIVWLPCAAAGKDLLLSDTEKAVLHDIRYYI